MARVISKKLSVCKVNDTADILVVSPSYPIIGPLLSEKISDGKNECIHYSRDVSLLFNQERLSSVGVDTVNAWLSQLSASGDSNVATLRGKFSDDQLLSLIKSRHIQSLSELSAWTDYLNENYQTLLDEIKKASDSVDTDNVDKDSTSPSEPPSTSPSGSPSDTVG